VLVSITGGGILAFGVRDVLEEDFTIDGTTEKAVVARVTCLYVADASGTEWADDLGFQLSDLLLVTLVE